MVTNTGDEKQYLDPEIKITEKRDASIYRLHADSSENEAQTCKYRNDDNRNDKTLMDVHVACHAVERLRCYD